MATFIDNLESIVDEVSAWGKDIVETVVSQLAPDGRQFGKEKLTIEQQLDEYRQIRNDLYMWKQWINTKATEIQNTLINSGTSVETIQAINPLNIAIAFAIDYSSKMEIELTKRML